MQFQSKRNADDDWELPHVCQHYPNMDDAAAILSRSNMAGNIDVNYDLKI